MLLSLAVLHADDEPFHGAEAAGGDGGSIEPGGWVAPRAPDRIAVLTLDHPVEAVWVVRGADQVAARIDDGHLFVLDVVAPVGP